MGHNPLKFHFGGRMSILMQVVKEAGTNLKHFSTYRSKDKPHTVIRHFFTPVTQYLIVETYRRSCQLIKLENMSLSAGTREAEKYFEA